MPLPLDSIIFDDLASDPVSPPDGCMWYRSDLGEYRVRRSGVTKTLEVVDGAGYREYSLSFNDKISTSNAEYTTKANFTFNGTDNIPYTVSNEKITIQVRVGGGNGQVRVQDVTNDLTIAESAAFANGTLALLDMGTISNKSTAPAIWEIQLKNDNAADTELRAWTKIDNE